MCEGISHVGRRCAECHLCECEMVHLPENYDRVIARDSGPMEGHPFVGFLATIPGVVRRGFEQPDGDFLNWSGEAGPGLPWRGVGKAAQGKSATQKSEQ